MPSGMRLAINVAPSIFFAPAANFEISAIAAADLTCASSFSISLNLVSKSEMRSGSSSAREPLISDVKELSKICSRARNR